MKQNSSLLVVIDAQRAFVDPAGSLARAFGLDEVRPGAAALSRLQALLAKRPADARIVLVRSEYRPGQFTGGQLDHPLADLCVPGRNIDCEWALDLDVSRASTVVTKHHADASEAAAYREVIERGDRGRHPTDCVRRLSTHDLCQGFGAEHRAHVRRPRRASSRGGITDRGACEQLPADAGGLVPGRDRHAGNCRTRALPWSVNSTTSIAWSDPFSASRSRTRVSVVLAPPARLNRRRRPDRRILRSQAVALALVRNVVYTRAWTKTSSKCHENSLSAEVRKLRRGIRQHRDSSLHELCWHHPALWGLLPEKQTRSPRSRNGPNSCRAA